MTGGRVSPDMTVLDVVSRYRSCEPVFRAWDQRAGECLLCRALFDPLRDVAARYGLDLHELVLALEEAAGDD